MKNPKTDRKGVVIYPILKDLNNKDCKLRVNILKLACNLQQLPLPPSILNITVEAYLIIKNDSFLPYRIHLTQLGKTTFSLILRTILR